MPFSWILQERFDFFLNPLCQYDIIFIAKSHNHLNVNLCCLQMIMISDAQIRLFDIILPQVLINFFFLWQHIDLIQQQRRYTVILFHLNYSTSKGSGLSIPCHN